MVSRFGFKGFTFVELRFFCGINKLLGNVVKK
jgi:hypothetical protein